MAHDMETSLMGAPAVGSNGNASWILHSNLSRTLTLIALPIWLPS